MNAARLRSTSTSNNKQGQPSSDEMQRKTRANVNNSSVKPSERSGERLATLPKRNLMGGQSNSPSHARGNQSENPGAGATGNPIKSSQQARDGSNRASGTPTASQSQAQSSTSNSHQKIMITGDDILIEYVTRLMKMFSTNKIREEELSGEQ